MNIYERIKYLRMKKGLSQDELAEKVGYTHRSSIGKVENGLVDLPQSKIKAFADALDITPQELMGWFNEEPSYESRDEVLIDSFGKRLKYALKIRNKKAVDLVNGTGLSSSLISQYLNDKFEAKNDKAYIIAEYLNINPAWLLGFEEEVIKTHETHRNDDKDNPVAYVIPVLGLVQAGIPITAVENIIEYEELDPKEYKRPEEYFGLKINGDSMEPKLFKDDTVIVHQQSSVENNDIAIVLVNGEDATCKKVTFNDQGIILTSLNPTYPPMFYTLEQIEELPVTIVGKVVELRRKF